ncbi:uncharacterized protein LOC117117804 [Anneissia japonica]|uniref:uncharacterized protein LOC117117804 n=1 Tax=Anneissia japonica TaxID=1529436 RepID=UPI0014258126|nr:uncharacterized protein LOC117117804 [Anneissia japonica]
MDLFGNNFEEQGSSILNFENEEVRNMSMESERIAREINSAFVAYKLGNDIKYTENMNNKFFKYCEKMYKLHNEHLYKLCRDVLLDSNENIETFFKDILTEMFNDNVINWGRMMMVFVFGARLAVLCKDRNKSDLIDQVIQSVDKYVKTEFLEWINIKGGCNNFDQSYTQHKPIAEIPLINVSFGLMLCLIATFYLYKHFVKADICELCVYRQHFLQDVSLSGVKWCIQYR